MLPSLPLRRRKEDRPQRFKRGVFLLPSLLTVGNLFCGYACVVYATKADYDTAALLIGIAMVLDTLDGFFARLTGTQTSGSEVYDLDQYGAELLLSKGFTVVTPYV